MELQIREDASSTEIKQSEAMVNKLETQTEMLKAEVVK
jgi:hypothetical protein